MSETIELTVVLPCLNEAETLEVCIKKIQECFKKHKIAGEVLIADNGSTDGSQKIAKSLGTRVESIPEKGYGSALMGGITKAKGTYILMADADDSYDLENTHKFLNEIKKGHDLVIGNRFKGGIKKGAMPFLHKYLGNPVLSLIGRILFKTKVGDFHCGMRCFKKQAILDLNLQTTGMEFASEMILKAAKFNLKIKEIPTRLFPDGRSRKPHLRTWRDGWRHLRFMILLAPRWLFYYPGLILIAIGITLGIWIETGPKFIGKATLDVHTLLYAGALILVGFQAVIFAIFSRIFAVQEGLTPPDKKLESQMELLTLEKALILGATLVIIGLILSIQMVLGWKATGFGELDPSRTLRTVIPAVLFLIFGSQLILYGSFLGTLKLGRKRLQNQ